MGVGRFICVAFPLILTIASIIALLAATLSGVVSSDNLHLFSVDVSNLQIDPSDFSSLVKTIEDNAKRDVPTLAPRMELSNVTAKDLGLADEYDINLWNYCYHDKGGKAHCTKHEFNWAASALNTTFIEDFGSVAGVNISLPDHIKDSLKTFKVVIKWTEISFIVSLVALGVELFIGLFATCSRVASCLTWLVALITGILVGISAGLATATATIVVGVIEGTAKWYGAKASLGGGFLAAVWIAAACGIISGLFWLFTICCCAPTHDRRGGRRHLDTQEKFNPTGTYAPLNNDHEGGYNNYNQQNSYSAPYGAAHYPQENGRSDLAYEPYSHRA